MAKNEARQFKNGDPFVPNTSLSLSLIFLSSRSSQRGSHNASLDYFDTMTYVLVYSYYYYLLCGARARECGGRYSFQFNSST